ncbi:MAG: DNA circularization N-terminal domain-containing protein [Pseudomonadota bacterium]
MAETVLIGDLELTEVRDIRVHQTRKLAAHAIPGWNGDLIQDLGEASGRIELAGIVTGEDASGRIEALRGTFASAEPQDFAASAAVASDIDQVLPEQLDVTQSGQAAGAFGFSMSLRRYVPPPPPTIGGFDAGFLSGLSDLEGQLGLDQVGALADALGEAQGALNALGEIKDFIEEAAALIEGAGDIQKLLDAAGKVFAASDS